MVYANPWTLFLSRMDLQSYERYIPNAFDESLTLLEKVNKVAEALNKTNENFNQLADNWNQFAEWANSGQFEQMVTDKINEMLSDDTILEIIENELLVDIRQSITNIQTAITALENSTGQSIQSLTQTQSELTNDINEMRPILEANTNSINDLKSSVSGHTTSIGSINDKLPTMETNIESNKSKNDAQDTRLTTLEGKLNDTGWVNATLLGEVTNYGTGTTPLQYRKLNGVVYLRGAVQNITAINTDITTMPTGFRPPNFSHHFMGPISTLNNIGRGMRFTLTTNGYLRAEATTDGTFNASDWIPINTCFLAN